MTNADAATATPTTTPSTTPTSGYDASGAPGASSDTPVTGDEAAKASAAVTAKDSAVTVTSVRKDPDGSYDVLGTKAGAPVMVDVTADLATVTQSTMGAGPHSAAPSATSSSSSSSPRQRVDGHPLGGLIRGPARGHAHLTAAHRGCISVGAWRA